MNLDLRSALFGAAAVVVAALIFIAGFAASGIYNIGADAPHWGATRGFIAFVRERSIAVRARDIVVPPLNAPERIADGASDYDEMCKSCHLAPGVPENEMRPGLYPKPPKLAAIPARKPAQIFWIIKHGIKMSAMPAWGKTHSDDEIWNIVAFTERLPTYSPEQYRTLVDLGAGHHKHDENMEMGH
jgi:mono/diheme cytochrome c family protein